MHEAARMAAAGIAAGVGGEPSVVDYHIAMIH